jgi:hypothetical protein
MARNETWADRIAREAKERLLKRYGYGWKLLTPDVQEAMIARDVLAVMAARGDQKDDGESPDSCWRAVMRLTNPD